ncbi:hypothetical protein P8452_17469 [Trifolium repens]|nr:hypothetical protein P8452_17469 [Trifolium repens]
MWRLTVVKPEVSHVPCFLCKTSPSIVSSLYAPPSNASLILKGPSKFAANFPPLSFPIGLFRTKSPSMNLLAITRVLYLLAARCLETNSLKWALSLNSCNKSRFSSNAFEFSSRVRVSLRQLGGFISAGIMASVPYTIVKGASPVEDWGVV